MRIRILETIVASGVDARLKAFRPGVQYDIARELGNLFVEVGWAEEVVADPATLPLSDNAAHEPSHLSYLFKVPPHSPLASVDAAVAADMAYDDAIAAAIELWSRRS